jgi:hypothetical protein
VYTYTTNKARKEPFAGSIAGMLAGGLLLRSHPEDAGHTRQGTHDWAEQSV